MAPTLLQQGSGGKTWLGRYELLLEMGHGGMATLFLARLQGPKQFSKLVAIKKIHDHLAREETFVDMFLDEARIAALIDHPNVATIFDMGDVNGTYYLAMEYVHGQTLGDIMKAASQVRHALPWPHAASIVADAAAGLHAAHVLRSQNGEPLNVVHRDISPQNILISYDGHVKVVDFGVAYAAEKLVQTSTGTIKGKVAYMSPEQTQGDKLTFASDIFSLGVVLFEAMCIHRLFKTENEAATIMKVRDARVPDPLEFNPDLPPRMVDIIMTALAKDPDRRFGSAEEMSEHIRAVLSACKVAVTRHDLATLLSETFRERKQLKDKEIKEALEQRGRPTQRAIVVTKNTETSLTEPPTVNEKAARPRKRSRLGLILVICAGSAALLMISLIAAQKWLKPRTEQTDPARPTRQTGTEAAEKTESRVDEKEVRKDGSVTLKITVTPEDALVLVTFRGQRYKGSVFKVVVPQSDKPERIVIDAKGFLTDSLVVVPFKDCDLTVKLRPAGSRPRRKPSRRESQPRIKMLPDS